MQKADEGWSLVTDFGEAGIVPVFCSAAFVIEQLSSSLPANTVRK